MTTVKIQGMDELQRKLKPDTVKRPLDAGIKKIALTLEGLVKKGTVVDTGRLRSSIFTQYGATTLVGTNVEYAPFVEYGTAKMEARHMEGSAKITGKGMFAYGLEQLKQKMGDLLKGISIQIDRKWGR